MSLSTEERIAEILAMRGVDARNSVRKEESVDVLRALIGTEDVEAQETRILVLKPAKTRLTALENGEEEKPKAKKTKAKKTKAKKTKAKTTKPPTPRTTPEGGPVGTKTCPSCKETGDIADMFGYRRMKTKTKEGDKVRTAAQSHCRTCRAKKAKKKAASKAA
jgi:hypothetical protein